MAMMTPQISSNEANPSKAYTKGRNLTSYGLQLTDNDMTHWDITPPLGYSSQELVATALGVQDEKDGVPVRTELQLMDAIQKMLS